MSSSLQKYKLPYMYVHYISHDLYTSYSKVQESD